VGGSYFVAGVGGAHNTGTTQAGGLAKYVASLIDKTLNWDDINWVRKQTTMKIVVKVWQTISPTCLIVAPDDSSSFSFYLVTFGTSPEAVPCFKSFRLVVLCRAGCDDCRGC
jgi:hypothetical protein